MNFHGGVWLLLFVAALAAFIGLRSLLPDESPPTRYKSDAEIQRDAKWAEIQEQRDRDIQTLYKAGKEADAIRDYNRRKGALY